MKNTLFCGLAVLLSVAACKDPNQNNAPQAIGGDRNAHDCAGSAGYAWSEVQERCIRYFEEGIKLLPVKEPEGMEPIFAAYAVFSSDSLRAELLLPEEDKTFVLDRRALPDGGFAWNAEDDDTYNLRGDESAGWTIDRRGEVLYRTKKND